MTYIFYSFLFDVNQGDALIAIIVLIVIDFITGFASAKISGEEIKSAKVFRSAIKLVIYFMMISAAHMVELASGILSIADDTVIAFLAVTELISLIENIGKMGFAVPKKMLNKLQDYRDSK